MKDKEITLVQAVAEGKLKTVEALLEAGANIKAKDKNGYTPLDIAKKNSHLEIVYILEKNGSMKNKEITLAQSVRSDNILIAKDLIKKGADVNAPDSIGWTPINLAAFYGRTEIAQALITAGVDVNTTDGRSAPLHEAAQYGHTKIVQALIEAGANVDATDGDGYTPLLIAVFWNNLCTVKALLKAGADVKAIVTDGPLKGYTSLHIAARNDTEDIEIVQALLEAGADVKAKNENGRIPLNLAWTWGDTGVLELLKAWE